MKAGLPQSPWTLLRTAKRFRDSDLVFINFAVIVDDAPEARSWRGRVMSRGLDLQRHSDIVQNGAMGWLLRLGKLGAAIQRLLPGLARELAVGTSV